MNLAIDSDWATQVSERALNQCVYDNLMEQTTPIHWSYICAIWLSWFMRNVYDAHCHVNEQRADTTHTHWHGEQVLPQFGRLPEQWSTCSLPLSSTVLRKMLNNAILILEAVAMNLNCITRDNIAPSAFTRTNYCISCNITLCIVTILSILMQYKH